MLSVWRNCVFVVLTLTLGLSMLEAVGNLQEYMLDPAGHVMDEYLTSIEKMGSGGWSSDEVQTMLERNIVMDMLPHETHPSQAVSRICHERGLKVRSEACQEIRRSFYALCKERAHTVDFLDIPSLAFGMGLMMDWGDAISFDEDIVQYVKEALRIGYRHIDTAEMYGNDRELGVALKQFYRTSGLIREDIWITSKVEDNIFDVESGCRAIIERIDCDYIDLFLLHIPVPVAARRIGVTDSRQVNEMIRHVWRDMERLISLGLVKHIGVSNHGLRHLKQVLNQSSFIPYANQIEFNPFLQQSDVVEFCKEHGIRLMAFSTQAPFKEWQGLYGLENAISEIAEHLNLLRETRGVVCDSGGESTYCNDRWNFPQYIAPSHVLLRYTQQKGLIPVIASKNLSRLEQHHQIFQPFSLRGDDLLVKYPYGFSLLPEHINLVDEIGKSRVLRIHRNGDVFGDSCHLSVSFTKPGGTINKRMINTEQSLVLDEIKNILMEELESAPSTEVNNIMNIFEGCYFRMQSALGLSPA